MVVDLLTTVETKGRISTEVEEKPMFGENLKKIRGFRGFTKTKLSQDSGISEYAIAKIEKGTTTDPRHTTLEKLANAMKVDVSLFYQTDLNLSQASKSKSSTAKNTAQQQLSLDTRNVANG